MLYVTFENGRAVNATTEYPDDGAGRFSPNCQNRNDWHSMAQVEQIAAELTAALGETFIATDAGAHCSPRYDITALPKVGSAVSKAFNGDAYPVGVITAISKTHKKITTSTGATFFRFKRSGSWVERGTWSLVKGHISERNPSF